MRYITYTVAIATLAGAVAGCADSSYPRYGYQQPYSSSRYNDPTNYSSYPVVSNPNRYGYGSTGDYNRSYSGTRSSPQIIITLPN
jgi:hypothetical protein